MGTDQCSVIFAPWGRRLTSATVAAAGEVPACCLMAGVGDVDAAVAMMSVYSSVVSCVLDAAGVD